MMGVIREPGERQPEKLFFTFFNLHPAYFHSSGSVIGCMYDLTTKNK